MAKDDKPIAKPSRSSDVDAFLSRVAAMPRVKAAGVRGRLLFAMDATASREPTWDMACGIQGDMFAETAKLGGLDVQLVYYRGYRDFRASPWVSSSADLIPYMTRARCRGGPTQLGRVLRYALAEGKEKRINALVFVGDAFEEDVDAVCTTAGELGMLGVPCFMFQEGENPLARSCFRQIAMLTKGAYCHFDVGSARELKELLSAVAVFAAGGRPALADYSKRRGAGVRLLAHQVK
jgi:hypothetical protein